MGYSRFEGGKRELRFALRMVFNPVKYYNLPVVGVECLKLRKVPVERRDISCTNTPNCTNLENVTW